ncbi:MAG: divergent polysaccharide deacetylase family protein [Epsilonproteobacteria bacterium]|nr:divergent polysaccharide deacetylase family protein [Campylobacterota bacterium]
MSAFRVKEPKRGNHFLFIIIFLLIILSSYLGYSYYLSQKEIKTLKREVKSKELLLFELQNSLKRVRKEIEKKNLQIYALKKENENIKEDGLSEIEDYLYSLEFEENLSEEKKLSTPPKTPKTQKPISKTIINKPLTPKLAIILDDVAFRHEVREIKKIPFKITPSFFPPSKRHPDTYKLAKEFACYMIHLPMEAYKFSRVEENTLKTKDSPKRFEKIIKNLRAYFPKATYLNNHTGSKFTADLNAMRELYPILSKYGFRFVDSKTSPKSKALIVAREFNETLLSRDIFLDNIANETYIKNQLKKAVKLAKKRGYAIAIGHPRKTTLKALRNSKNILKGVDVVYIKDLDTK